MVKKKRFKALELSGEELDGFISKLVDKLYSQIWADAAIGQDEAAVKERLGKSIVEALREYAEYRSNEP